MNQESNVIDAEDVFLPETKAMIGELIKQMGPTRAMKELIDNGVNPVLVRAIVKNIIRRRSW